jgi:hypothetical protein
MERRYVERGLTEGGPYSLYEIRIELLRRLPKQFDVRHVAERIIELARSNPAQLTTYGALWQVLRPGEPWMGNNSQRIIGNALGQVIAYCHHHRLPILTVLVINAAEGGLTEQAITNIARECRDLGMDTGPNDRDFVDRQVAEARAMTLERLPADPVP